MKTVGSRPSCTSSQASGVETIALARGRTDPPTCQHALRQAKQLAQNLQGEPQPYGYRMLGQVATLGRFKSIADVMGIRVAGFPR